LMKCAASAVAVKARGAPMMNSAVRKVVAEV